MEGLEQRLDAKVFVFLGRWVKQKGMDYIADVTEWRLPNVSKPTCRMLTKYETAQLLVIGPVGDAFGSYAAEKFNVPISVIVYHGSEKASTGLQCVPRVADTHVSSNYSKAWATEIEMRGSF
eukprot:1310868-Amphidinium_carterae.1